MRLLHVLPSLNPAHGGPVEAVRLLSLAHKADGHEVEIASLDGPGDPTGQMPFVQHLLGPARGGYGYTPLLVKWLKENHERFDAVIVNGLWQYAGFGTWRALGRTRTPYYVFPHGMLDPWFKRRYPLKHLKKWLYWPWAEYRVLRDAAATLFTCEEEKQLAKQSFRLYRTRAVVTGLGTRVPEVDLPVERERFLTAHPDLRGKRVVLFMGRIHPKKGCDLLLKAFAAALPGEEWRLVFTGPDQVGWQAELQQLSRTLGVERRVCWTGAYLGESRWAALAAAEVFALPSHQENFGIAVAEALACGVPVLISHQVNIWREIAEQGGGLIGPDTVEGTIELLREWASLSADERMLAGARARDCFRGYFDVQVCAERLIQVIRTDQRDESPQAARR